MNSRERWMAAVQMQPVDRLPFWPKLDGAYLNARPEAQGPGGLAAVHEFIGSDDHVGMDSAVRDRGRRTSFGIEQDGNTRTRTWGTPFGDLVMGERFDAPSWSWHPMEFPVKTVADIRALTAWYEDVEVVLDEAALAAAREQAAKADGRAVLAICTGTSALMEWAQNLAGIENAHLLLHDYPAEVAALFGAMHQNLLRKTALAAETSPADLLYLNENTSTTLISVKQYRELCYPHLMAYATVAAHGGPKMVLHMCGHLRLLLDDLATLPVRAFEAFTTPTLGNTTLLDGRTHCPDKCLIGGTNAMLWTQDAATIIAAIEAELDALPHHRGVVVTSAGVMPPMCEPETIRAVAEWVRACPARM